VVVYSVEVEEDDGDCRQACGSSGLPCRTQYVASLQLHVLAVNSLEPRDAGAVHGLRLSASLLTGELRFPAFATGSRVLLRWHKAL